ncbi:MAG TPA: biotin/lipoyl-binding protein, partial [Alphaproteobacteria bacterium]|nr:biotin/lipoyl-binding protein [Alphaproteobacteria bacterium]
VSGLLLGFLIAVVLVLARQTPRRDEATARAPTLTTIEVQPLPFRLVARGYGVVRPAESWQATANVPGRVVERHPDLESGHLVRKGTLLLVLDPSRYELAIAQAEADLISLAAEQAQLDREEQNTRRLLELERERLVLAEQQLARIERLAKRDAVSRAQRDEQLGVTVAQRSAVASLENQVALIPARRKRLEAGARSASTRIDQARQDLLDTRFEAPYDLRVDTVGIELHQHAAAGQQLFRADGIEAAEIEAHVPLDTARRLMGSVLRTGEDSDTFDLGERLDFDAIEAEVALVGAPSIRWPARVVRVASGLDPTTRTARIVVRVERPYEDVAPPLRPALQPGMYVRVHLSAPSPEPLLAVPATAVHAGQVYRVVEGERLERRSIEIAFEQNDLVVVGEGLAPGDEVIVDDPVPALDGMAVRPQRDEGMEAVLRARARGETP